MLTLPARRRPEIHLTSFVDVFFNLLAFILIVGSLEKALPSRLDVELPRPAMAAAPLRAESALEVILDRNGHLRVGSRSVTQDDLAQMIRGLQPAAKPIVLWADRRLPYEQVVALLALVQKNGGKHVRLAVLGD